MGTPTTRNLPNSVVTAAYDVGRARGGMIGVDEMEEDEFRRSKGVTEIEALREWRKIPEHIRKLLLANAFCHNCGTTEFAPGYTLRMCHGRVLIEGCCTECGAEVARLCD